MTIRTNGRSKGKATFSIGMIEAKYGGIPARAGAITIGAGGTAPSTRCVANGGPGSTPAKRGADGCENQGEAGGGAGEMD